MTTDMARYSDKEKRREYLNRYQRETARYRRSFVGLSFSLTKDADILDKLESVDNKTDYIRTLVRADINK